MCIRDSYETFIKGKTIARGALAALIILAVIAVTIVFVIVLSDAVRRIPVQYAKKMQGRKMMGGQSTFIPLKVNTAGVIPVIFAQSLFSMPSMIASVLGVSTDGVGGKILAALNQNNWFNPDQPVYSIGLIVYVVMIIGFAYFYLSLIHI